ncbi:MAG TPA: phage tail protein, partial [Escherichia sp.]|nr:phage tail protein [Escherichia sp.]
LLLDEISAVDREKLSAWMAYKREVKAVDISTASVITWPSQPEA